jgi:hypothetical protein
MGNNSDLDERSQFSWAKSPRVRSLTACKQIGTAPDVAPVAINDLAVEHPTRMMNSSRDGR